MKRINKLVLFASLLIVTATTVSAGGKKFSGDMVIDGSWHGNEVVAEDGENWMALAENKGAYSLQEVKISVTLVEDAVLDTPPTKTGKEISLQDGINAIALLRNIPQLQEGPVPSAEIVDRNFGAGEPTTILFNGMPYELVIACDAKLSVEEIADCPLELSGAGKTQQLMIYPVFRPGEASQGIASDATPQVLWAGDLDNDGLLDLIVDLTNHYNVSAPTLLLSSQAKESELVHPVAEFRTTGC